jgi:hypothetical protein
VGARCGGTVLAAADLSPKRGNLAATFPLAAAVHFLWSMAMPEFWYDAASDTRDLVARERALDSHTSMLGLAVLVFALVIAALLIAR